MILDMDNEKGKKLFTDIDKVFDKHKVTNASERMILATLFAIEKQGYITYEMSKFLSERERKKANEDVSMFG